MKIGLYGAIANASYVTARALHNQGVDIVYIRDHLDMFPFSQPVWEDAEFTLPYDYIVKPWTIDDWIKTERLNNWTRPEWVKDPLPADHAYDENIFSIKFFLKKILDKAYINKQSHRIGVIAMMRQCDVLYVCGIEAEILAWVSDVPYVIWPHGGDIRMAAGLSPFKGKGLKQWISYILMKFYLRMAYRACLWIGTHDPKGIGGNIGEIPYQLDHFPLPLLNRPEPFVKNIKHKQLKTFMDSLNVSIPDAEYYVLIPSRVDFLWKGTDLLLKAISQFQDRKRFHFIFSGWGQDYHEAQLMIESQLASFLPCSLSKPLLFRLYQAVDVVVDQFLFGSYGAAAIEAMSCGTPVMMYIDDEAFYLRGWEPPPVLNAKSERDILNILIDISEDRIKLADEGKKAKAWFERTHSEKIVVANFINKLNNVLSA